MALVWSLKKNNTLYEVRSAGKSTRLYTNKVLHSAYNPTHKITASIWDLLFLPGFFHCQEKLNRILLLGVGGGTVIHMLNRYFSAKKIIGVEVDPVHIEIAQIFFGLRYKNLQLVCQDAIQWVNEYKGQKFDLVIEDIFVEKNNEPVRLQDNNLDWLNTLHNLLSPHGVLVINHATKTEAQYTKSNSINNYQARYQFSIKKLQNRVLALLKQPCDLTKFNENLAVQSGLLQLKRSKQFRYHCSRI